MTYDWQPVTTYTDMPDYITVECVKDCCIGTETAGVVEFVKGNLYGARRGSHGIGHIVNQDFVGPKGPGIKIAVWNTFITRYFRPTDRKVVHDANS